MPLLHKDAFHKKEIPPNLKDTDLVFYHPLTDEIFDKFEDFGLRTTLLNSMEWTCAESGRTNLTYEEALNSERNMKKIMKCFSKGLRVPILYLTSLTERTAISDLTEDVYSFARNRFFIGECVEANLTDDDKWIPCRILQVIEPIQKDLATIKRYKSADRVFWPPARTYHYEIKLLAKREGIPSMTHAQGSQIRRKKSSFSRDFNALFIKKFIQKEANGIWTLKEDAVQEYNLQAVTFDSIFVGNPPKFHKASSGKKGKGQKTMEQQKNTIDKYLSKTPPSGPRRSSSKPQSENGVKKLTAQEKLELKKQQKQLDSQKKKDEKKRLEEFVKQWNRTKEDLELEDLKPLPTPKAIELSTPNEHFGDIAMIHEFFHNFSDFLSFERFFPYGVSVDLIDRALSKKELAGPFSDLITVLLQSVFYLQDEEDGKSGENCYAAGVYDTSIFEMEFKDATSEEAVAMAKISANWSMTHQGLPVRKLPLNAKTLTEVLRLHLLVSGASANNESVAKWRQQERGSYVDIDDPAVHLRVRKPHILHALSRKNVAYLDIGDKVEILSCLMGQILTFSSIREVIDEEMEKIKLLALELRPLQAAEMRKEKEVQLQKQKDKKEKLTAEELQELERKEEEIRNSKADLEKRRGELADASMRVQLLPLGMDRAFRMYWISPSIPGLFVEDSDTNKPPCLPHGTPIPNMNLIDETSNDTLAYVRRLFQQEHKENLELESSLSASTASPSKRLYARLSEVGNKDGAQRVPFTCTGDDGTCCAHSTNVERVTWAYLKEPQQLEDLIEALNPRGRRESKLRTNLTREKERILANIARPSVRLHITEAEDETDSKKSGKNNRYKNSMFNFPEGSDVDSVLESLLREAILDMEEKINAGGLGLINVIDREEWRKLITSGGYDKQCDKLTWGQKRLANENEITPLEGAEVKPSAVRPAESYRDPGWYLEGRNNLPEVKSAVKDLASAILQISQSVGTRYLKKPLGICTGNEIKDVEITDTMRNWEISLMASTTLEQLFIHLLVLNQSISWRRSALKASCRICKKTADPESMLLCDNCNKGHHLYCLKPKLVKVPKGDWYCDKCKPLIKPKMEAEKAAKKAAKRSSPTSDEEENGSGGGGVNGGRFYAERMELTKGKCALCKVPGTGIVCSKCCKCYHMDCLVPPLRKPPSISWFCHECRLLEAKKELCYNGFDDADMPTSGSVEPSRFSRRRISKAANEKISQFVKRLRYKTASDNEQNDMDVEDESSLPKRRPKRHTTVVESPASSVTMTEFKEHMPLDNAALQELLKEIMHVDDAWPFLRPVSKNEARDYSSIIKKPMDFATLKHNLNMLRYHTNGQVINDSLLIFSNCFIYNKETTEVYQCGIRLMKYFRQLCESMNFGEEFAQAEKFFGLSYYTSDEPMEVETVVAEEKEEKVEEASVEIVPHCKDSIRDSGVFDESLVSKKPKLDVE